MKPVASSLLSLSAGLLLGGWFAGKPEAATPAPPAAPMAALIRLSASAISEQHCEFNGSENQPEGSTRNATVGDFIASFIRHSWQPEHVTQWSCNGRQCQWSFGSNSPQKWNRILRFEYDQSSQSVNPKSLLCVDIP